MLDPRDAILYKEREERYWPMATDSTTALNQTEKQHLAELAERTGDERVRAAVHTYLEEPGQKSEPNGAPPTEQARPIWEVFDEIIKTIPEEEFAKLPTDGAEQHDHYIYGLPKKPR